MVTARIWHPFRPVFSFNRRRVDKPFLGRGKKTVAILIIFKMNTSALYSSTDDSSIRQNGAVVSTNTTSTELLLLLHYICTLLLVLTLQHDNHVLVGSPPSNGGVRSGRPVSCVRKLSLRIEQTTHFGMAATPFTVAPMRSGLCHARQCCTARRVG